MTNITFCFFPEYILEQIRLNLKKKDFIRTMIQSRKMNRKTIELEGFQQVGVYAHIL